jgi:Helix-turn-helix domain
LSSGCWCSDLPQALPVPNPGTTGCRPSPNPANLLIPLCQKRGCFPEERDRCPQTTIGNNRSGLYGKAQRRPSGALEEISSTSPTAGADHRALPLDGPCHPGQRGRCYLTVRRLRVDRLDGYGHRRRPIARRKLCRGEGRGRARRQAGCAQGQRVGIGCPGAGCQHQVEGRCSTGQHATAARVSGGKCEPRRRSFLAGSPPQTEPSLITIVAARKTAWPVPEFAELWGVSPRMVYDMVKDDRIPSVNIGGTIRLDPPTTAGWLRKRVRGGK